VKRPTFTIARGVLGGGGALGALAGCTPALATGDGGTDGTENHQTLAR